MSPALAKAMGGSIAKNHVSKQKQPGSSLHQSQLPVGNGKQSTQQKQI